MILLRNTVSKVIAFLFVNDGVLLIALLMLPTIPSEGVKCDLQQDKKNLPNPHILTWSL